MLTEGLAGLRVLIASDDPDLGHLFVTVVTVCGGIVERASSADEALTALERRPHVVLFDVAMAGAIDIVSLVADELKIPVVAFLFRHADPPAAASRLRGHRVRLLPSTDVFQVCSTLQRAVAEAA